MADRDCSGVEHERELRDQWQRAHEQRHDADGEALAVAREEVNRRLDDMNELRRQIDTERGKYLDRDTYDREHNVLRDNLNARIDVQRESFDARLKALENTKSNLEGRMWAIGAVISALVVGINLILHYWGTK